MDFDQLIRLSIRVSGTVQRVGYRHIVQNIARKHNITGSIENLEGYDVKIIAEGTRKDLKAFVQAIKICEFPIQVECIESTEEPYIGNFSYFEVIRGTPEEELAERLDSAIAIFSRMEKKQDQALEMHKESISLQKETLNLQKETLDEIKGTRSDLDKGFNSELREMREELREIRNALIQAGIMNAVKGL
ncbi:MAG TPA: acylphosphatase [Methanospirillum sp.]|uniref:acylphosphatase n=1 Tax=Methanospirillum sp. TaxID=45200 RepID=UPI002B8EDCD6|nr:acylphosphatase [Methanospirillum sp.]HOJ96134.1 acylphosphatase [Methanospirillum sp.]HOL41804.1 acylphosphatase [Methanospirillum sp.]HPP77420.1 acylphosphatase [Methanospirillum sp.]